MQSNNPVFRRSEDVQRAGATPTATRPPPGSGPYAGYGDPVHLGHGHARLA